MISIGCYMMNSLIVDSCFANVLLE